MDESKIARINELYHKSKEVGLSDAELKEQLILRKEYIDSVRRNLRGQLDNISVKEADGSIDFGGEVGTRPLMLEAWKLGKTVWVPKVHGETMDFYEITSFDELKPGAYGILEPDAGIPASADDGLMIMPGVAFDTNRNRVGYGGGYYDRYLESHPQLHTLALAFDMQVLFEVPAEEQDIKPQLLVTETNIYQEG